MKTLLDPDLQMYLDNAELEAAPAFTGNRYPTGSLALDMATGGGWPLGMLCELVGHESYGKTTVALLAAAAMQKRDPSTSVAFIDIEHSLNTPWAGSLGVNTGRLIHFKPGDSEEAFNAMRTLLKTKAETGKGVDMIILDSVQALSTRLRNESVMEDQHMTREVRSLADVLRRIGHDLDASQIVMLVINGLYMKMNAPPGHNPYTAYGGKNLGYKKAISIELLKPKAAYGAKGTPQEGKLVGHTLRWVCRKNKTANPFLEGDTMLRVWPHIGIDRAVEAYDMGRELNIIVKDDGERITNTNSTAYFNGEKLVAGRQNVIDLLYADMGLLEEIEAKAKEAIHGT